MTQLNSDFPRPDPRSPVDPVALFVTLRALYPKCADDLTSLENKINSMYPPPGAPKPSGPATAPLPPADPSSTPDSPSTAPATTPEAPTVPMISTDPGPVVGPTYVPDGELGDFIRRNQGDGKSADLNPVGQYSIVAGTILSANNYTLRMNGTKVEGIANPKDSQASSLLSIYGKGFQLLAGGGMLTATKFKQARGIVIHNAGATIQDLVLGLLTTGVQFWAKCIGQGKVLNLKSTPDIIGDSIYIGGGTGILVDSAVVPISKTQHNIRISRDDPSDTPTDITVQNCQLTNVGNETLAVRTVRSLKVLRNTFNGWVRFGQADDNHKNIWVLGLQLDDNNWTNPSPGSPLIQVYSGLRDGHANRNQFVMNAQTSPINISPLCELEINGSVKIPVQAGLKLKPLIHIIGTPDPKLSGTDAADFTR